MIEVKGLSKRFGRTVAVDDISFSVPRGEVLGFLGPNAAGKTTTMRIITCFMPADAGEGTVAGFDTLKHSIELRRRIGYLPENNPLYQDMEVISYLNFIADVRGISRNRRRGRVGEMVDVCGLAPVVGWPIAALSKGFKQRVGLAQTLIHEPEVLILDEPTTGLDPTQIVEIRDIIKEIGRERTVILSSHILTEVQATCDRILIINEGKLVGSGTPEELARQSSGGDALHLVIRSRSKRVAEDLKAIQGIVDCREEGEDGGDRKWVATVNPAADPREDIFRTAVKKRWVILEMYREAASLEDVFLKLTAPGGGEEGEDA